MSAEQVYNILLEEGLEDSRCVLLDDHIDWGNADPNNTDRPVLTEEQLADLRAEIISSVIQAYQTDPGSTPGEVKRLITQLTEPKMNWRQVLQCTIKSIVKNDFTWARPSRKAWHLNAVLPGMDNDETVDVAFAIDMSGSITSQQANIIISEIKGLMEEYAEFRLDLWSFDTKVYNHVTFTQDNSAELVNYEPMGGGGTTFTVNWDYMKNIGLCPKKFIMFTDGYCDGHGFGDPEYCDTLFIMLDSDVVAPFGDTIHYED
jgi:predicted metal-dependent peptidase